MRVFLDANVIFSAANSGSNVALLLDRLIAKHFAVTSDFALEEATRNVMLKRPNWSDRLASLAKKVELVATTLFDLPVELEEKDRPILCAAIRSNCDLLATGDRTHFGHLYEQTVEGVVVVSLKSLAERVIRSAP